MQMRTVWLYDILAILATHSPTRPYRRKAVCVPPLLVHIVSKLEPSTAPKTPFRWAALQMWPLRIQVCNHSQGIFLRRLRQIHLFIVLSPRNYHWSKMKQVHICASYIYIYTYIWEKRLPAVDGHLSPLLDICALGNIDPQRIKVNNSQKQCLFIYLLVNCLGSL